jgi:hypothetical protein
MRNLPGCLAEQHQIYSVRTALPAIPNQHISVIVSQYPAALLFASPTCAPYRSFFEGFGQGALLFTWLESLRKRGEM